jgi:hypothetical protein
MHFGMATSCHSINATIMVKAKYKKYNLSKQVKENPRFNDVSLTKVNMHYMHLTSSSPDTQLPQLK